MASALFAYKKNLEKSYRPINLSFFKLKTPKRLLDRFLREGTLTKYPLQESQHACQARKLSETAQHFLIIKLGCICKKRNIPLHCSWAFKGHLTPLHSRHLRKPRKAVKQTENDKVTSRSKS